MKPSELSFYILIAVLLIVIIFIPSFGWHLRSWLMLPVSPGGTANVIAQDEALKAQVSEYNAIANALPVIPANYIPAIVFSTYPVNFRNELLIDVGSADGIMVGKAVVIEPATSSYILVGKIENTFAHASLVQTVFDASFKMPVRIGANGYDALFVGGANPTAMSIEKSVAINPGDVVIAADSSVPYGLPIAEVAGVSMSSDNVFQQASLTFGYDIGGIKAVLVER